MATRGVANAMELATLALAKSIVEGDIAAGVAALNAGADPDAFWIDGRTLLRAFAKKRDRASIVEAIDELAGQGKLKKLPSMKGAPEQWSEDFVAFVAMRGYDFYGKTTPLSSLSGSYIAPPLTAKVGVNSIAKKWRLVEDATCSDGDDGKASRWRIWFGADWRLDKRIVGFWLEFTVDARSWALVEMFNEAKKSGNQRVWPDHSAPLVLSQKNWEGAAAVEALLNKGYEGLDDLVNCMRRGGSPFYESHGKRLGEFDDEPEIKAFMGVLREEVGPQAGWHIRIKPLLTKASIKSLQEKAALRLATPRAKTAKKSLKDRTDIM